MNHPEAITKKHILIVDDDEELSQTMQALLEAHQYTVSAVTNGVEALKLIMQQDVDAIICDLMMPQMAGDMFYMAVERVKPHLCTRFLFITGYEKHPKFAAFLKRVRCLVLYKPLSQGSLIDGVRLLITHTLDRRPDDQKKPAIQAKPSPPGLNLESFKMF